MILSISGIKVTNEGEEDIEVPNGPDGNPASPVEVYKKYSKYLSTEEDRTSMTIDAFSNPGKDKDGCATRLNYT